MEELCKSYTKKRMRKEDRQPTGRLHLLGRPAPETLLGGGLGGGVDCFYPLIETCGSCRIPSPPPDPTESCHFYCSALKHSAAITSVMRYLHNLFNLSRHSFALFVFPRSSSTTILRVSRSQRAQRLHERSKSRCPPKHQPKRPP